MEGLGDLARLSTGLMPLHWEVLDVTEVLTDSLELCQPLLLQYCHHVTVSLPEEPGRVEGDRTRPIQVLVNLILNAAKYTPEGGQITVEVRISKTEVSVSIRDTGQGIPAEVLPHIFEWGVKGDCSDSDMTGWGVGLAVVERLMTLHRGRVEARSGGIGQGAEFTVYLLRWASGTPD